MNIAQLTEHIALVISNGSSLEDCVITINQLFESHKLPCIIRCRSQVRLECRVSGCKTSINIKKMHNEYLLSSSNLKFGDHPTVESVSKQLYSTETSLLDLVHFYVYYHVSVTFSPSKLWKLSKIALEDGHQAEQIMDDAIVNNIGDQFRKAPSHFSHITSNNPENSQNGDCTLTKLRFAVNIVSYLSCASERDLAAITASIVDDIVVQNDDEYLIPLEAQIGVIQTETAIEQRLQSLCSDNIPGFSEKPVPLTYRVYSMKQSGFYNKQIRCSLCHQGCPFKVFIRRVGEDHQIIDHQLNDFRHIHAPEIRFCHNTQNEINLLRFKISSLPQDQVKTIKKIMNM